MKTLFIFLLGLAAGAAALHFYRESTATPTTPAPAKPSPAAPQSEPKKLDAAKAAISEKIVAWHLTPAEIKDDLVKTGHVVRTKATEVGHSLAETTTNARIISIVNTKYTLDKDLTARAIDVSCDKGHVTLRGTVASHELVARAIELALDTTGVTKVSSLLTVK